MANDVAFLAMDLDFRQRPDLAAAFTRRMAGRLDDADLLLLLDFYKCYRAYVRGKVFSIKSLEPEVPSAERETSREKAEKLFQLALSYAVAGSEPMVLAVTGRVGTGKSSLAQVIGRALGAEVFSSDRTRKELAGLEPHVRADTATREEVYSKAMTDRTYETINGRAIEAARITEAPFSTRHLVNLSSAKCYVNGWPPRAFKNGSSNWTLPTTKSPSACATANRARRKSPTRVWKISRC